MIPLRLFRIRPLALVGLLGGIGLTSCVDDSVLDVLGPLARGTIQGTVSVNNEGVPGILVEFSGPSSGSSSTDSEGGFRFDELPFGAYSVKIGQFDSLQMVFERTLQSVELNRSNPSAHVPFPGRRPLPGGIAVKVLDVVTGGGVMGAKVSIQGMTVDTVDFTPETGSIAFDTVPIGEYHVRVLLPLGHQSSGDMEGVVAVTESSITAVEFTSVRLESAFDTVQPGSTDTLSIGSGAILIVSAPAAALSLKVSLEIAGSDEVDWGGYDVVGEPVVLVLEPEVNAAPSRSPAQASEEDGFIALHLPAGAGSTAGDVVVAIHLGLKEFINLTVESEATSFVDPITGKERSTLLVQIPYPTEEGNLRAYFTESKALASCSVRGVVSEDGSDDPGGKTPLLLIHGWQRDLTDCPSFKSFDARKHWSQFIDYWNTSPDVSKELRDAYSLYLVTYPTYESIAVNSGWLAGELEKLNLTEAVIIGHSMGGLVGRGVLLSLTDLLGLKGVITLGTPHEGSPVAKYTEDQLLAKEIRSLCPFGTWFARHLGGTLLKETQGFRDLNPGSDFITTIKNRHEDGPRVFTLGSTVSGLSPDLAASAATGPLDSVKESFSLEMQRYLGCAMQVLEKQSIDSDGIVPLNSALPHWTAGQRDIPDILHTNLAKDQKVFGEVITALEAMVPCTPPPPPLTANDFNFSASISRTASQNVEVVVNPIVIDGKVVTGLSADNFTVIENGCVRPFTITTAEGNVGVDIAFAQDMSGSMGTVIRGVRESVIGFAETLKDYGLNVRFASIGYSGPGTIPSTPGPSPLEYLGPVHTQSSAEEFQAHVASKWVATGGGDGPENGLEAIEWLHQNLPWRSGAARTYIDITDISHHTKHTNCNGRGACTDHDLASIVALMDGSGSIHVVAPADESRRNYGGGLDPWKLADATGGTKMVLGTGYFDLTRLGISEVLRETVRLSFTSSTRQPAVNHLRVRVTVGDKVAELAPGAVFYVPPTDVSLVR